MACSAYVDLNPIGKRYRDAGVIWILGGDRPIESDVQKEIIRAKKGKGHCICLGGWY